MRWTYLVDVAFLGLFVLFISLIIVDYFSVIFEWRYGLERTRKWLSVTRLDRQSRDR